MIYALLVAINFFMSSAYQLSTVLFIEHTGALGASLLAGSLLTGLFFVSSFAVRPFCAGWAQSRSAKALLIFPAFIMALCVAAYAAFENMAILVAARVLHGAAFALGSTAAMSIFAGHLPKEKTGLGMGLFGLGQTTAVAAGPAMGIFLKSRWGDAGAFWGACAMMAACFIIALFIKKKAGFGGSPGFEPLKKQLLAVSALFVAFGMVNGMDSALILGYVSSLGWRSISWYFAVTAALLIVGRPLFGRLRDKRGLTLPLVISAVAAAAFCIVMFFLKAQWLLAAAAALKGIALGASQPALQAACVEMAGPGKSGPAAAAFYMGADMGQALGPVAGAAAVLSWGYAPAYALMIVPVALTMAIYPAIERGIKKCSAKKPGHG